MLAFLTNFGLPELLVILVIAVLIFGKDLPQAASKAYMQARKLRNAVDDLRRDSGIERELRDIERNVREAEWEARKARSGPRPPIPGTENRPVRRIQAGPSVEASPGNPPESSTKASVEATPVERAAAGEGAPAPEAPAPPEPPRTTDAAS